METKESKEKDSGQPSKEEAEEGSSGQQAESEHADTEDTLEYYRDLVEKAESVAKLDDWSYVSMELDNIGHRWDEGPQYTNTDLEEEGNELFEKFQQICDDFEERRKKHYEELNKKKQQNLERKKELLDELREIVEKEQWKAENKVKRIKKEWDKITLLPKDKGDDLDEEYQKLLSTFDEHKVDYFASRAQREEENLQGKLLILDKMEELAESIDSEDENWKEIHNRFKDLNRQWKKIGKVPKEKRGEVWGRYKDAQDKYNNRKYEYDEIFRKKYDKHLGKKNQLIKEAEELTEFDDIAKASSKVNKLHRRWKKAGNLPQKKENELWKRFKKATDAFNKKKSENIDLVKQQEEEHYQQKLKLIEEAEEVKETDDFKRGHDKMQSLMKKWKEIGPAPHKKSEEIWQQFKGAMDYFYDRRREHRRKEKERQKENLEEKEKIVEQLRELGDHEDPIEAVDEAKKLQKEFKDIGYVPIKQKNTIWKKYRKACDVIYDRYRAAKRGEKSVPAGKKGRMDPEIRSKIRNKQKQVGKLEKQVKELEQEVIQFKETRTYFSARSEEGNALQQEIEDKIENAENELEEKKDKLEDIRDEIEDLKEQGRKDRESEEQEDRETEEESDAESEESADTSNKDG